MSHGFFRICLTSYRTHEFSLCLYPTSSTMWFSLYSMLAVNSITKSSELETGSYLKPLPFLINCLFLTILLPNFFSNILFLFITIKIILSFQEKKTCLTMYKLSIIFESDHEINHRGRHKVKDGLERLRSPVSQRNEQMQRREKYKLSLIGQFEVKQRLINIKLQNLNFIFGYGRD